MNSRLGAIKNIASQTLPNHPGKFGTFVQKITLYPFFALREPTISQNNTHSTGMKYIGLHGAKHAKYRVNTVRKSRDLLTYPIYMEDSH